MDRLLKPTEVAERLAVSRAWVYEAAKVGRIPAVRIGGDDGPLRFVAEDVERWLDEARASWTPGRPTAPTGLAHPVGRSPDEPAVTGRGHAAALTRAS